MDRLNEMKHDIISQIQDMELSEFEEFFDLMKDVNAVKTKHLFSCETCEHLYGLCNDDALCSARFEQYALTEKK